MNHSSGSGSGAGNKGQKAPSTVFCTPVAVHNIASFLPPPLGGGQQMGQQGTQKDVIPKLFIRAVGKTKKKDTKTFVLRNICVQDVTTVMALKDVIKKQLGSDIDDGDFDVGVMEGSSVVNLRTQDDLKEFWVEAKKGSRVFLWCDALKEVNTKSGSRRRTLDGSDSDEDRKGKSKKRRVTGQDKEERVQETIEALKQQQGASSYTMMQLRIWSEMIQSGMHKSYKDPPTSSMFQRAGGNDTPKRKSATVADIAAHAATQAIASTLTQKAGCSPGTSPGRIIENRSKCYRQLSELNQLKASGVLSPEEYEFEKEAVMKSLKNLSQ